MTNDESGLFVIRISSFIRIFRFHHSSLGPQRPFTDILDTLLGRQIRLHRVCDVRERPKAASDSFFTGRPAIASSPLSSRKGQLCTGRRRQPSSARTPPARVPRPHGGSIVHHVGLPSRGEHGELKFADLDVFASCHLRARSDHKEKSHAMRLFNQIGKNMNRRDFGLKYFSVAFV